MSDGTYEGTPPNIRSIELDDLGKAIDYSNFAKLEELVINDIWIEEIPFIKNLPYLKSLEIICYDLKSIRSIENLPSLEIVEFRDCYDLEVVNGLESLPKLRYLSFTSSDKLKFSVPWENFPVLEKVVIPDPNGNTWDGQVMYVGGNT